jgi:hypothetical protein
MSGRRAHLDFHASYILSLVSVRTSEACPIVFGPASLEDRGIDKFGPCIGFYLHWSYVDGLTRILCQMWLIAQRKQAVKINAARCVSRGPIVLKEKMPI